MAEEGGGRMRHDHPDRPRPEQDRPHAPVRRCTVSVQSSFHNRKIIKKLDRFITQKIFLVN